MSFKTNIKGTSIDRKHKERKRSEKKNTETTKKMSIGKCISIIILSINGLNSLTKNWLAEWIQKQDIYMPCCHKTYIVYTVYYTHTHTHTHTHMYPVY